MKWFLLPAGPEVPKAGLQIFWQGGACEGQVLGVGGVKSQFTGLDDPEEELDNEGLVGGVEAGEGISLGDAKVTW